MFERTDCYSCYCIIPVNIKDRLLLNNQPNAPIIQIYSVIKLYTFRASSLLIIMEFSTVHSALVSYMQVFDDRFQVESGCSFLTVLGRGHQKPA